MDTIFIRDLEVHAIIGTLPEERLAPQKLILNLEIFTDMERAAISDDLRDAVDYSRAEAIVKETAESSSFFLLEALAGELCRIVKILPGVQKCGSPSTNPPPHSSPAALQYKWSGK